MKKRKRQQTNRQRKTDIQTINRQRIVCLCKRESPAERATERPRYKVTETWTETEI